MTDRASGRHRAVVLSVVKHAYVPNAVAAHPRCEVVAVADDPDQPEWVHERNARLAEEVGAPYLRDVDRALVDFDSNFAVVSSQAERHCDLGVRAAEAGLHVLQDKPMSTRLSECDRLIEALDRNGRKLLMWNRNTMPAILHARELVNEGAIGEPRAIHIDFYFANDVGAPLGSRGDGEPPIDWLEALKAAHPTGRDGAIGSKPIGEFTNEGIYPLAYLHALVDAPVERVFARFGNHFQQVHADAGVEDLATVTLQLRGGAIASVRVGRIGAVGHTEQGDIKIRMVGSEGALVLAEPRPELSVTFRGQAAHTVAHARLANEYDRLLVDNFLDAIESDRDTLLNARAARHICAVVEAAGRSAGSGRVETVAG